MKIGFIDYYLDEWHANTFPKLLREQSGGQLEVAYAYAEIDSPLGGLTTGEWCARQNVRRCADIAQVVELSDALIVLSPDNWEMHESLCQLPLASGKNTYVDKTFAPSKAIAEGLFALAAAHNTPCYSSSALRYAPEYTALAGIEVSAVTSIGPNAFETYAIHQLEPLSMLIPATPRRVLAEARGRWMTMLIEYEDGRVASMTNTGGEAPFFMQICGPEGNKTVQIEGDYYTPFISALAEFLQTGKPPVDSRDTISIMALLEAGQKAAAAPGSWIHV